MYNIKAKKGDHQLPNLDSLDQLLKDMNIKQQQKDEKEQFMKDKMLELALDYQEKLNNALCNMGIKERFKNIGSCKMGYRYNLVLGHRATYFIGCYFAVEDDNITASCHIYLKRNIDVAKDIESVSQILHDSSDVIKFMKIRENYDGDDLDELLRNTFDRHPWI